MPLDYDMSGPVSGTTLRHPIKKMERKEFKKFSKMKKFSKRKKVRNKGAATTIARIKRKLKNRKKVKDKGKSLGSKFTEFLRRK